MKSRIMIITKTRATVQLVGTTRRSCGVALLGSVVVRVCVPMVQVLLCVTMTLWAIILELNHIDFKLN